MKSDNIVQKFYIIAFPQVYKQVSDDDSVKSAKKLFQLKEETQLTISMFQQVYLHHTNLENTQQPLTTVGF